MFERLDFLYVPSDEVARDLDFFERTLGGRVVFAIASDGVNVAALEMAPDGPLLLLTDHLEDERPILIYRVDDLTASLAQLESLGWKRAPTFEIPHGPCCSFIAPGAQRIAIYELTRPEVAAHFDGRRDF